MIPEVDEPVCCAPWAILVRPVVAVVYLAVMLPFFIVTVLSVTLVMFLQVLCVRARVRSDVRVCVHVRTRLHVRVQVRMCVCFCAWRGTHSLTRVRALCKGLLICCRLHAPLPPDPGQGLHAHARIGATVTGAPRIFFDGSAWAFGFALGAARHMHQSFDFKNEVEVIGVSAGNVAAICLLLGKDPWELVQALYPRFRRRLMCHHCSRPLIGFCSRLGSPTPLLLLPTYSLLPSPLRPTSLPSRSLPRTH